MFDLPNQSAEPVTRPKSFDWSKPTSYDDAQKRAFHRAASARLRALAIHMAWPKTDYELRTNKAGCAVSGEITLHHDRVYISVSQPRPGSDTGILIRSCRGRRDYVGGPNTFAPIRFLDDIPALAERVSRAIR